MRLDVDAARAAIENRLGALGGSAEEIGSQMTRIIVGNMLQAVRTVSVQRGRDPRGLAMFAYGGASGLFAAQICRGIGISKLIVPNFAAVFSAAGLLAADPIRTEARTVQWSPQSGALESINDALAEMHESATANLAGRGFAEDEIQVEYILAMRFAGQTFDVDVPVEPRPLTDDDREPLIASFQERYAQLYGAGSVWENFPMLAMTARVVARGIRPKPSPARFDGAAGAGDASVAAARRGARPVYLIETGAWQDVECFEAGRLPVGQPVEGPCIVEDLDTTIFVPADARVSREPFGGFEIEVRPMTERS
jgi:N-methylhydantoinase A